MNYKFIIIFFLLSALSCNELDYNIPLQDPRIVLNAFIDNELGCQALVSKTGPIIWKNDSIDILSVDSARVSLYENGNFVQTLTKNREKKYISNGFLPKVGFKYKLKASVNGLTDVESEEIVFEEKPIVTDVMSRIQDNAVLTEKGVMFNYILDFDPAQIHYYLVDNFGDNEWTYGYFHNFPNANYSCDVNYLIFSTKCLQPKSKIRYGVSTEANGVGKTPKIIYHKLTKISKLFFDYQTSHELNNYKGWEMTLAEPYYASSNIKNGLGIFYFKNSITLTHRL